MMVEPTQTWIGWSLIAIAGFILMWSIRINDRHIWQRWWVKSLPKIDARDQTIRKLHDDLQNQKYNRGRDLLRRWGRGDF